MGLPRLSALSEEAVMDMMVVRLSTIGVVAAFSVAATPQEWDPSSRSTMAAFEQRVAEYAVLHRRLEARMPPLESSTEPERFIVRRRALAAAIMAARPRASQGEFFDPAAARMFRRLVQDALRGLDVEALLRRLFEEHPKTWGYRAKVYESYPNWATREVPGLLLHELPVLPDELEYRVIDHDLAILDAEANLILDVLPAAIGHAAR
jgi:hypothetical protein